MADGAEEASIDEDGPDVVDEELNQEQENRRGNMSKEEPRSVVLQEDCLAHGGAEDFEFEAHSHGVREGGKDALGPEETLQLISSHEALAKVLVLLMDGA